MSQNAIEEKLGREFKNPITTERQVVYILAEIRKLIEFERIQSQYPALNFHCNWALHSRLSISPEARRIVEVFDRAEKFFTQMDNTPPGQQMSSPDWSWQNELIQATELQNFKLEFQRFCNLHNVTGRLVSDEPEWAKVLGPIRRRYRGRPPDLI